MEKKKLFGTAHSKEEYVRNCTDKILEENKMSGNARTK
jgi:hypothetical protein